MTPLDRRSNMPLWSHVLDESEKTNTIIRPLVDVAKEQTFPFSIQVNNKKVKACGV